MVHAVGRAAEPLARALRVRRAPPLGSGRRRVAAPRQYFWMTMAFATTRQRTPRHVFWMTTAANQSDGRWSTP